MTVRDDRGDVSVAGTTADPFGALEHAPAEVRPAGMASAHEVDLLVPVAADVADHQSAGGAIEREPIRIAQPVRPDLRPGPGHIDEGVVARHDVRAAAS